MKELETITLAVNEQVLAVKHASAIVAKGMVIATNKTQNNMGCSPDESGSTMTLLRLRPLLSYFD